MENTPSRDVVWGDLAVLAFELLAKPDARARDNAPQGDAGDAEEEEPEQ
jgi:hypothetical protein